MRYFILHSVLVIAIVAACLFTGSAAEAPTLTDVQKLTLQNKYLAFDNAKLRLEAAQLDLVSYLKSLDKDGYTLDIGSASYIPIPVQEKK